MNHSKWPEGTLEHRIRTLRLKLLVHSYIYYSLMTSVISDDDWQKLANELAELQRENPEVTIGEYDKEFADWTGDTGYHLPKPLYIQGIGDRLVFYRDKGIFKKQGDK